MKLRIVLALREVEEQKKREARVQQEAKEAECKAQQWQIEPDTWFIRALSSKSKPNLQDIAQALSLDTSGQKKGIMGCIMACVNADPTLCEAPCFEGPFNQTRQHPAQMDDKDLNMLPSDLAGLSSSILPLPLASNIVNTYSLPYPLPQHVPFPISPASLHPPFSSTHLPPLPAQHYTGLPNPYYNTYLMPH